jgi:drug/metabolite transporter (DMT)-like permease
MQTQTIAGFWPFPLVSRRRARSQTIGWIALSCLIFTSATFNSFAKQLGAFLSPLSLLFFMEFLAAFFVLLTFGAIPTLKRVTQLPRKQFIACVILGFLNSFIAPLLWFIGLRYTSAVNAELFGKTEMLMFLALSVIFLHEKIRPAHLIAGLVMLGGITLVALQGFAEAFTFHTGDALLVSGTFVFALGSIVFKKYLIRIEPQVAIFIRSAVAVLLFFLLSPFVQHPLLQEVKSLPLALIPILLSFAFISRFLNLFCFYQAIERLPVTIVSYVATLDIVAGIIIAHFYLGESIQWYHVVGGCLIIAAAASLKLIGIHRTKRHLERHAWLQHRHHY